MSLKQTISVLETKLAAESFDKYKKDHPGTKKTKSDPMFKDVTVYDNGGKTADRYTVVHHDKGSHTKHFYGMSKDPHSPQGFNQYAGSSNVKPGQPPIPDQLEEGPHLGKKLKEIPEHLHKAIKERIADT